MPTPITHDQPQNWDQNQWKKALQNGAYRGLKINRLTKAIVDSPHPPTIKYDQNTNTLSIVKGEKIIVVDLNKLQKNKGLSLRRELNLSKRSRYEKDIDPYRFAVLADKIHAALHPPSSPPPDTH